MVGGVVVGRSYAPFLHLQLLHLLLVISDRDRLLILVLRRDQWQSGVESGALRDAAGRVEELAAVEGVQERRLDLVSLREQPSSFLSDGQERVLICLLLVTCGDRRDGCLIIDGDEGPTCPLQVFFG